MQNNRDTSRRPRPSHDHALLEMARTWLATLSFVDGLSVAIVMLSLVLFKRFGLTLPEITLYVALLWLPLALRPVVETMLMRVRLTPRSWIVSTEAVMAASFWVAAYTLIFLQWRFSTMLLLWLSTMAGVVHHVALRRYQLQVFAKSRLDVAERVGRVCHGLALVVVVGVCTMIGGNLEVLNRNIPTSWAMVLTAVAMMASACCVLHLLFLRRVTVVDPKPTGQPQWTLRSIFAATTERLSGWANVRLLLLLILMGLEGMFGGVAVVFLVDASHNGGVSLSPQEFGLAMGSIGVMTFVAGMVMRRSVRLAENLRKGTGLVGAAFTVQFAMFLLISYLTPVSLPAVIASVAVAELAHGAAMSAFFELLDRSLGKRFQSQSRAGCVAVASLLAVVGCAVSGLVQDATGYHNFFILMVVLGAVTTIASSNRKF